MCKKTAPALAADRIGERPKVLHSPRHRTNMSCIFMTETPDYGYAHIGVAVADAPTGPFAFQTTITWRGYLSRDIGVFQDEDGSGYIMSEDRDHGTHIYRLADDYLTIVEDVACERATDYPYGLESPTIIKKDGLYYWFGSQLTSWDTNDNKYSTATTCTARGASGSCSRRRVRRPTIRRSISWCRWTTTRTTASTSCSSATAGRSMTSATRRSYRCRFPSPTAWRR